jgi:hypothetical protein
MPIYFGGILLLALLTSLLSRRSVIQKHQKEQLLWWIHTESLRNIELRKALIDRPEIESSTTIPTRFWIGARKKSIRRSVSSGNLVNFRQDHVCFVVPRF